MYIKRLLFLIVISASLSSYSQEITMQNGTFNSCTGTFTDSGGASGNYGNDENFVITICPDASESIVVLNFTQFSTQFNSDVMTIYDGDSTSAPIKGTFSGANSPGNVQASEASINPTGCLTIAFTSNAAGNTTGWLADISCLETCQDIQALIVSTTPPASGGIISVDPGDIIQFSGNANFSNDGTGATYLWDFGDSNASPGQDVNHSYVNPGTYTVTLLVTDTNPLGCSG